MENFQALKYTIVLNISHTILYEKILFLLLKSVSWVWNASIIHVQILCTYEGEGMKVTTPNMHCC